MRLRPLYLAPSRYGFLFGVMGLLIVVPVAMMFETEWGYYPHSVGLYVRITPAAKMKNDQRLILTLSCVPTCGQSGDATSIMLNGKPTRLEKVHRSETMR